MIPIKHLFYVCLFVTLTTRSFAQEPGTLDTNFKPELIIRHYSGTNGKIKSAAIQSDGKILIGGEFTTYRNISRPKLARLNTDGSLDTTFNPKFDENFQYIESIEILKDDKILFLGYKGYNCLMQMNADGSQIEELSSIGIESFSVSPEGKIFVRGYYSYSNSTPYKIEEFGYLNCINCKKRFYKEMGKNVFVSSFAFQKDGKIITVKKSGKGFSGGYLKRFNEDATQDSTFIPDPYIDGSVGEMQIQSDGYIYIYMEWGNLALELRRKFRYKF